MDKIETKSKLIKIIKQDGVCQLCPIHCEYCSVEETKCKATLFADYLISCGVSLDMGKIPSDKHVFIYKELMSIIHNECPELERRQDNIVNAGKIHTIYDIEEMLIAISESAEFYTELFRHAGKTYIVKPKFALTCDVIWVLNNIEKVKHIPLADSPILSTALIDNRVGFNKNVVTKKYTAEELNALYDNLTID